MRRSDRPVPGRLALTVASCCIVGASAALGDGTVAARLDHVLTPPQLAGWKTDARDPNDRLPRLSALHLHSEDGAVDVDIGIHVLALGRQSKDHVGVVPLAEWLPKSKRWLPVGHGEPQCFRQEALSPFDSPNRGSSGQARCRHRNFVLIFNLFSRLDRRRSEATWKNVFPGIVTGTKTTERCLDPEQMTFLADYENPPFPSRAIDPDTMVVASMCGSGGCRCFRCDPSLDRRSRTCSDPHDATA